MFGDGGGVRLRGALPGLDGADPAAFGVEERKSFEGPGVDDGGEFVAGLKMVREVGQWAGRDFFVFEIDQVIFGDGAFVAGAVFEEGCRLFGAEADQGWAALVEDFSGA